MKYWPPFAQSHSRIGDIMTITFTETGGGFSRLSVHRQKGALWPEHAKSLRKRKMIKTMTVLQAEEALGDDYVISRAITWRTSKYLCFIAGQRDPSEYWACAVWNEEGRKWTEPTLVFRRLPDLVAYYQDKMRQRMMASETLPFSSPGVKIRHAAENIRP